MTQPTPMRWENILYQVVGAKQTDRSFADKPWFRMVNWQGWRNWKSDPWNDALPENTGDGKFTVYRKSSYPNPNYGKRGESQTVWGFQILEFSVDYFAKSDGDRSPHDNYGRDWTTNFTDSVAQMNGLLDEQTFYSAANAFDNSAAWFQASSQRLKPWIDNVDTKESGFQGSAAEAFRYQVLNLQYGFDKYREQLTTPQSWASLIRTAGDQVTAFKQTIQKSWQSFVGLPTPRDIIVSVLHQIEQQVDQWDKDTKFGTRHEKLIPADYSWNVVITVGNNTTTYNLVNESHIAALDFLMRWSWANQVVEFLDRPALGVYTPLNSAIEAAYTASASPITLFEYPVATPKPPDDPNNPNDPNKPPPDIGDGNDGNDGPNHDGGTGGGGGGGGANFPNLGGDDGDGDGGADGPDHDGGTGGGGAHFPDLGGDDGNTDGGTNGPNNESGGGGNFPDLGDGGGGDGNNSPATTLATTSGGGGGPGDSGSGSGGDFGPLSTLLNGSPNADGTGGPTSSGGSGAFGFPLNPTGGGSTGDPNKPNAIDRLNGDASGSGAFDDFSESNAGGDDRDRALGGSISGLGDLPNDVRTIGSLPGSAGGTQSGLGTGIPSLDNPAGGFPPALQGGSSGGNSPGSSFLGGSSSGSSFPGGSTSGGDGIGGLGDPADGWEVPSSAGGLGGDLSPSSSGGGDFSGLGGNGPAGFGSNGGLDANGLPVGDVGAVDASAPGPGGPQSTGSNGTMGGMPFMPPMGGGFGQGGGQENKDRERSTWLTEDEDVWGTDPDCAPAVIGRDDSADFDLIERGDWERVPAKASQPTKPAKPAGPDNPTAPGRAR